MSLHYVACIRVFISITVYFSVSQNVFMLILQLLISYVRVTQRFELLQMKALYKYLLLLLFIIIINGYSW